MTPIYIIRGSHANQFELQNYDHLANEFDIHVVASHHPLTSINLPIIKLWSPADLPLFPFRKQIFNRLFGGTEWLIGLEKVIKSGSIVHTAETYSPYTHQALQLRNKGYIRKLICTCWETIPHNNEKFARLRNWKLDAYKYVDIFHTPTLRAKQALITEGVDPAKIYVIPYGVDLTRFTPVKVRVKNNGYRPRILTVARLEKEKGMEIIHSVAQALPQYDFIVVGLGTYQLRGDNISIKNISYSDIHREYQQADLFFFPSVATPTWEEQYGMALIEAMACGLPIIAVGSGAVPEVLGSANMIIPPSEIANLVSTLRQTINNENLLKKMSLASRSRAIAQFDTHKFAKELKKLYLT